MVGLHPDRGAGFAAYDQLRFGLLRRRRGFEGGSGGSAEGRPHGEPAFRRDDDPGRRHSICRAVLSFDALMAELGIASGHAFLGLRRLSKDSAAFDRHLRVGGTTDRRLHRRCAFRVDSSRQLRGPQESGRAAIRTCVVARLCTGAQRGALKIGSNARPIAPSSGPPVRQRAGRGRRPEPETAESSPSRCRPA